MDRKGTYIRNWRKHKGFSLDDMVGRLAAIGVETTSASLSRIERGIQPYSQDIMEAMAESLGIEVWQFHNDNPDIPTAPVGDLVGKLTEAEARQAEAVLRAMFEKLA
ncbi:MAG: helix-turn-helix transcriptional regulator [Pseudomonadota bacterium]